MNKIFISVVVMLQCCISLQAQTSRVSGFVSDTTGYGLILASVMIMDEDSTLVDFTQTDDLGKYRFTKVPYGEYLLKVTYLGFIPKTIPLKVDKKETDVEDISIQEINTQLMEVVVKAARAPLKMKGDTIEFDISQFKVPQNSTLEDLVRRLPGMEVGEGGRVTMDGKDVTSVKVDGKNFFGNNPTMATKNLPADAVSSVQVYDRKTDEQLATNAAPTNEKEMNVVLKEDFKNLTFGKGVVGAGNMDRLEGKLSLNRFAQKHQYSLLANGNNTGRNGLGWEDSQDFFGSQAYTFQEFKYGFGGGMRFFNFTGDGDDLNLDGKIQELFWGNNNRGFPTNGMVGLNYNYETDKVRASTRYIFNHRGNEIESFRSVNRFLPNNVTNFDTTTSVTNTGGNVHRLESMISVDLDSFNTVSAYFDFSNLSSDREFQSDGQSFINLSDLISSSDINNDRSTSGHMTRGTLVYSKKFRKKARFFAINSIYGQSKLSENTLNNSFLSFSSGNIEDLNQTFLNDANKSEFQINATFTEPIGSRLFFNVFHNYDNIHQVGDINVKDRVGNQETVNTLLTRNYTTNVRYNFSGASMRYSYEGLNISLGYGYQFTDLMGDFEGLIDNSGSVNNSFANGRIFADLYYQFTRTSSMSASYSRGVNNPRISQITPIINNVNPLFIIEGNPNLQPEVDNSIYGNIWISKPASGFRLSLWSNVSFKENAITQEEVVTESLITTTRPINYKNAFSINFSPNVSFAMLKNKLRASVRLGVNNESAYRLVNRAENKTVTTGFNPSTNLNFTVSDNFTLLFNYSYSQSNTSYSINKSQDQRIVNQNMGSTASIKLLKNTYFNGSYTHRFFKNDRFGQNTNIPIINMSLARQFLKNNQAEIRISAYDLLDKNRNFSLSANNNIVSQNNTLALARYFMMQFSYNIKGMKSALNTGNSYW